MKEVCVKKRFTFVRFSKYHNTSPFTTDNFSAFSSTDSKFNVSNSRTEFIEKYQFIAPNVKITPNDDPSKPVQITKDALVYVLMGVPTLLKIDSFSLQFKEDIKDTAIIEMDKIEKYVSYVMTLLPKGIFFDQQEKYKGQLDWMVEFYDTSNEIVFNVKQQLSKETIAKIYSYTHSNEMANYYLDSDTDDEDIDSEFHQLYEHINFAYGVKHGYITLSKDPHIHVYFDPYFQIDLDPIQDYEGICYPTQRTYENWSMEKWIDLLP